MSERIPVPPWASTASAVAFPMPDAAPVITTTLSASVVMYRMIESVQLFSPALRPEERKMTVTSERAPMATDTRARIPDAGEEAVRRFGLRRVSMAEVAELARVSRGSVYRYFPDRGTLVAAVLRRTAERFVESSAASIRRRRTLAAQVGEAAVFIREHIS